MAKAFKGGLGKRAETELHPSRARTGTEPWLAFARLFTGRFFWGCVRRSSFASTCCARDGCTPQNRWKMRFFTEGWRRIRRLPSLSVAFRRFPSLRNRKDFFANGHQTGQARSFKFQVPSSKFQAGTRRTLVRLCPRKSPFVRLLHEELFLRGRKGGWIAEFKNQETKAAFCFNTERYSPNVHLNGDGNQSS